MRVLETHGRLARRFHFNMRRDALYNILVGGGEREQRRDCDCSDRARKAPPGRRRPARAAVPAEAVAGVAAAAAAAAAQPVHAFSGGPEPASCVLVRQPQTTGLFTLQPECARRAAQIAYFPTDYDAQPKNMCALGKMPHNPNIVENNKTRPSGRGREPSAPDPSRDGRNAADDKPRVPFLHDACTCANRRPRVLPCGPRPRAAPMTGPRPRPAW